MTPLHTVRSRANAVAERARHSSAVAELREPTYRICVRMSDLPPHIQFNALMLAAVVSAEALGLDPHEEIARAGRKVRQAEGPFTIELQALRDYCRGELTHTSS